ncbi:MAG: hypothetical protein H6850_04125 [Alphaproteobacteria bacterium]|nr:MAG: hypothetical protein H6850_04125 [Alphaproteobacteria bacterium]
MPCQFTYENQAATIVQINEAGDFALVEPLLDLNKACDATECCLFFKITNPFQFQRLILTKINAFLVSEGSLTPTPVSNVEPRRITLEPESTDLVEVTLETWMDQDTIFLELIGSTECLRREEILEKL